MGPEQKEDIKALQRKVREILMEWDPIGVRDMPEAQDEYDSYVGPICSLLIKGAGVTALAKMLDQIEGENMGLSVRTERNRQIAQKLLRLIHEPS